LPGSSEVLKLAVKQLKIRSHAGSSGMSQSFSLAFRLDKRAGDGHIEAICLIPKRIHLHDKRAGVSMSWVITRAEAWGYMLPQLRCETQPDATDQNVVSSPVRRWHTANRGFAAE
jgi:hypothetical protein